MQDENDADYWLAKSAEQWKKGEFEQALDSATRAIKLNPRLVAAYSNRGVAKYNLRRHEDAIKDHDEAIRLDPNFAQAYYNRGNAKCAIGRHEEAILDYDEAIRLNPNYAVAYSHRANARSALGHRAEAIKDYGESIRLDPNFAQAYYNRGVAKALSGKAEEALTDFRTFIRLARHDKKLAEYVEKVEQEVLRLENSIRAGKQAERPIGAMAPIPHTTTTERETQPEAVIFLDMVRSSDIMSTYGVDHHLNLYLDLIRKSKEIFVKYGCEYIKGTGDGFMAVAPDATDAAGAMVELMKWIDQHGNTVIPRDKYSVRIGIDYGQTSKVKSEGNDRFGERVVFASRLESLLLDKENPEVEEGKFPREGRIFISKTVQKQVLEKFQCVKLGAFELKGLEGTHTVWYVDWQNSQLP
jgi:tetratricopeptide (TPR) repeat protein